MHAAYIDGLGPATAIRYGELPDPEPAAAQVLVRAHPVVEIRPVEDF